MTPPPRIALVTCTGMPEADEDESLLQRCVNDAGGDAHVVAWNDETVAWREFDLCVVRSTWDYYKHTCDFEQWIDHCAIESRLVNPPEVMRWNMYKSYMTSLARSGVPVVQTQVLPVALGTTTVEIALGILRSSNPLAEFVAKPLVSGGSYETYRCRDLGEITMAIQRIHEHAGDAILQPYMGEVERYGERSHVWIGGEFSHVVRKSARFAGDSEHIDRVTEVPEAEHALARQTLAVLPLVTRTNPGDLLYARIDMVPDEFGKPVLMELELIEPSLFLKYGDGAAKLFARAVVAATHAARE